MTHVALSLALGALIGLSLGLVGGGGSILTVPILVYAIGQPVQSATTTSLAIVGINALVDVGVDYIITSIPRVAYDQEPLRRFARDVIPHFA